MTTGKPTRVLVTGGSGQLGRALVRSAPAAATVVAPSELDFDLSRPDSLGPAIAALAPDVIINAGAYTAVDDAESEPELAMTVNAHAVAAMAAAAKAFGARIVQVSTDFVFDGSTSTPRLPGAPRNPLSVYGQSKAAGEDAAGAEAIVVRTAWLHASGGANFVRTMLSLMSERDEISAVADQISAPTWATGLAEAIWGLARIGTPGIWHWTDAGTASWYDFAVAIQEEALASGLLTRQCRVVPIATTEYPAPAIRPAFSLLESSATRAALGVAAVHWRANLRRMLAEEAARG